MKKGPNKETYKHYVISNIGKHNFQYLIENSLNGISVIRNDEIVYRNRRASEIFGSLQERNQFLSLDTVHPEDREIVEDTISRIKNGFEGYIDNEFRFLRDTNKPNDYTWVRNRLSNVEVDGEMAVLIESEETTEKKTMERMIRIEDKMNSVGKLAAGVAHQIRNPLSGLNLYVGALKNKLAESNADTDIDELVEQVESASKKIESIVETVMQFSRTGVTAATSVNLNESVYAILDLIKPSMKDSNITILLDLKENIPHFKGDRDIVEQVITNIVVNAIEVLENYKGEKAIEIKTFSSSNKAFVVINDSGPGVPVNIRDEIFEPFYTTKKGGTGIGLALNQKMITQFGGEITVRDSPLGGAQFTIIMPLPKMEGKLG
ncbi:MAG: PAS domain S-box protein [candidate division Zixibacteria bacterium]|nr:PAS domain S-box protein [candidate division Zixibacteria bacterium]